MIRVLIADDSPAIRDGMYGLLSPISDLDVVGMATDGREAVRKAVELHPDVIIMDVQMPNMDGVEATRHIKEWSPRVGILMFSVFTEYLEASARAGADGCLPKDCEFEELLASVRRIAGKMSAKESDGHHRPAVQP